jgi:hypothetical protein
VTTGIGLSVQTLGRTGLQYGVVQNVPIPGNTGNQ